MIKGEQDVNLDCVVCRVEGRARMSWKRVGKFGLALLASSAPRLARQLAAAGHSWPPTHGVRRTLPAPLHHNQLLLLTVVITDYFG